MRTLFAMSIIIGALRLGFGAVPAAIHSPIAWYKVAAHFLCGALLCVACSNRYFGSERRAAGALLVALTLLEIVCFKLGGGTMQ